VARVTLLGPTLLNTGPTRSPARTKEIGRPASGKRRSAGHVVKGPAHPRRVSPQRLTIRPDRCEQDLGEPGVFDALV
jgi:hypothetical protein